MISPRPILPFENCVNYIFFCSFFRALEYTPAFVRVIHDEEMWLYKNPKSQNTISTELLFVSVILTRIKDNLVGCLIIDLLLT